MSLLDSINADLKQAMLAKDVLTRDTLRMLKTALQRAWDELEPADASDPGTDDEAKAAERIETGVLLSAVKSRKDAASEYRKGGREELAEKEEAEIAIIQRYLPEPLSEEEAKEVVAAAVAEVGATQKKDMGRVMSAVMAKYRGRVDGKLVSKLAAQLLD